MKIRKVKITDANQILKIINQSENLRGNNEEAYELKNVKNYINNKLNKVFVCEINNKIVGFFIAQFWKGYIYAFLIAVDKDYQGKGIGTSLDNFLEHLAKKSKRYLIEAYVEINNKKMISILKKRGYKRGKKFIFFSKKLK